jgi:hypothetical protein
MISRFLSNLELRAAERFASNGGMHPTGELPNLDLSEEVSVDGKGGIKLMTVGELLLEVHRARRREHRGFLYIDGNRFREGLNLLGEAVLNAAQEEDGVIYLSAIGRMGVEVKFPNPTSSWWVLGKLLEGPLSEAVSSGSVKALTNKNFSDARNIGLIDDWMGSGDVMSRAVNGMRSDDKRKVGGFAIASTQEAFRRVDDVFVAMVAGPGEGLTGSHAAMDNCGFMGHSGSLLGVVKPYKFPGGLSAQDQDRFLNDMFTFTIDDDGKIERIPKLTP